MAPREPASAPAPPPSVGSGGRLSLLALVAVVAVAGAGLWSISAARRGAIEGAVLAFGNEVAAHARALESRVAGVRSDLQFLMGSAPFSQLDFAGPSVDEWRRVGAESAVLLFLRGHPEVVRVAAFSADGIPVFHAGRRGGVPLLWVARNPTGHEGAAIAPGRQRLLARVTRPEEPDAPTLEIEIEPSELVLAGEASWSCRLSDASGALIASRDPEAEDGTRRVSGTASIDAPGWSAPSPWRLACEQPELGALALVAPLEERYRTTLLVVPVVMALTLILAFAAVQESRRRERLEARARQEARMRTLEQQLFHAERLATMGRLAAGIAHEINNPLEGMSNWLSLARRELAQGHTERADAHLARVKEGLERAASIVRQVLAQAEPSGTPRAVVDLHQVIGDTSRLVQSRREFSEVAFELDLATGPLLVRGNPVTLGQVTLNLLLNACEVQTRGGEVRVTTRRDDGSAVVEFADRGSGVPEEDRERIFEPFYTTKDSTGLGLSICHGIVRQHDGELSVLPREGGGSVFRLTLPTATPS